MLAWYAIAVMGLTGQVRFFCQDETRIGLKTISGRKITAKGVKPKGNVQCGSVPGEASPGHLPWQFKATYLYGVVEPATGEHFFYEFSHLNSDCFQVFLNLVSERYKDSVVIMQLDQAGAHRAKRLKVPDNIILMFQPSHSPEINPIERVWQHLKLGMKWKLPKDLDELREMMRVRLEEMSEAVIASIVGWKWILDAISVAKI
jgi:transposase